MADYRPLPEDQAAVFHEYVRYAFSPEDGPPEYDPEDVPDVAKLGSKRALYPDGAADADPLCVCKHYWFDARVRGDTHAAPGLSAVATPPERRRQGHVRRLLAASLEEYRDRGAPFSVLWPFRYRFYRTYGWDTCSKRLTYECDPDVLAFTDEAVSSEGSFRRLEADDWTAIEPVYEAHADDYALALRRDEEWWRHRVFEGWEEDPFVYAWERDGEVRSYVVYDIEGDWGDRTMCVQERAFVDHEASLQTLRFCYNHDSQISTLRLPALVDDPLLDVVRDPDEIDCECEIGPMVRIVDVAAALSALSYPAVDASLAVAVDDPLVEWNDGTIRLEVAGGSATCEPTGADPDVRIDVGALSQLAVGYRSASELDRVGRLTGDEDAVATLERLFPETTVYLRDGF